MKPQSYLRWEEEAEEGRSLKDRTCAQNKLPKQPKKKNPKRNKKIQTPLRTQDVHMDLRWQEIMHGKKLGRPLHPRNVRMLKCPPNSTGNCDADEVTGMVGGPSPVIVIIM